MSISNGPPTNIAHGSAAPPTTPIAATADERENGHASRNRPMASTATVTVVVRAAALSGPKKPKTPSATPDKPASTGAQTMAPLRRSPRARSADPRRNDPGHNERSSVGSSTRPARAALAAEAASKLPGRGRSRVASRQGERGRAADP